MDYGLPMQASIEQQKMALSLQSATLAVLSVIMFICLHEFIYHMRPILMPFSLSIFIALAVEPTVTSITGLLNGHKWPNRWCLCLCSRRVSRKRNRSSLMVAKDHGAQPPSDISSGGEAPDPLAALDVAETELLLCWKSFEAALDGVMRGIATLLVLCGLVLVLVSFGLMIMRGAQHIRDNWKAFSVGLSRAHKFADVFVDSTLKAFGADPQAQAGFFVEKFRIMYKHGLSKVDDSIGASLDEIVGFISDGFTMLVVISLYLLMWLIRPLPMSSQAGILVRSYIWKKTLVSALYGLSVASCLHFLYPDLAFVFGTVSFFLNYVPEVGAIISILLPCPVILLDGRLDNPLWTMAMSVLINVCLKVIFGNCLEFSLIEQDRTMSVHPVWVLLALNYFGFVWGPFGMLLSVPLLAILKSWMLSVIANRENHSKWFESFAESAVQILEGTMKRETDKRVLWHRASMFAAAVNQIQMETAELDDEDDEPTKPLLAKDFARYDEPSKTSRVDQIVEPTQP